jgi:hypothetical protein
MKFTDNKAREGKDHLSQHQNPSQKIKRNKLNISHWLNKRPNPVTYSIRASKKRMWQLRSKNIRKRRVRRNINRLRKPRRNLRLILIQMMDSCIRTAKRSTPTTEW